MFVLDTNVLSEVIRPAPAARVVEWLGTQSRDQLYTTAINQAELLYGVECMPAGRRKAILSVAMADIFAVEFKDRILAFDDAAARIYGSLLARRRGIGKPMSQFDAQIAAIVLANNAILVTRNVKDFAVDELVVIDPWQERPV